MKKYKTRHFETLKGDLFPQVLPQGKNGGETNSEPQLGSNPEPRMNHSPRPHLGHNPEPQQPTLDEIWEWLGNPDAE